MEKSYFPAIDMASQSPVIFLNQSVPTTDTLDLDYRSRYYEMQEKYLDIQEKYDSLVKGISSASRMSRKVHNAAPPSLSDFKSGSLRFYSQGKHSYQQIIAFDAIEELPNYLQHSLTENGRIMWQFENTVISFIFPSTLARNIFLFFYGNLPRFLSTYSIFVVGMLLFNLGLFQVVSPEVFYLGFGMHLFLMFTAFSVLVDLKLYLATITCLPNFALMVFVTLYPVSFSYMMDWDYRSIPLIVYNVTLFMTVIGEEAMPRRTKIGIGTLSNSLMATYHVVLMSLVNLGKFPEVDLNANIVTLVIANDNVTISALGMFNQSLVPVITLLSNLVYLYAAQWWGGKVKMKNISISLNYADDPKSDDAMTMKYFKRYLVFLGLEEE